MIGLLYRLIVGSFSHCAHKWETVDVFQAEDRDSGCVRRYSRYVLRCQHCGDIQYREVG